MSTLLRNDPRSGSFPVAGDGPVIVNLGDSYTWGMGVHESETFCAEMQRLLPAFQVVNAGLGGASVENMEDIFFEHYADAPGLQLVVLTLLDLDILRGPGYYYCDEYFDAVDHEAMVASGLSRIGRIAASLAERRIGMVVMLWPCLIYHTRYRELRRRLKGFCDQAGIHFIDDLDRHLELLPAPQLSIAPHDPHPSPLAHTLAARRIVEFISAGDMLAGPSGDAAPEETAGAMRGGSPRHARNGGST